MLSFFPRDVLDEILDLIEPVSEGFPWLVSLLKRLLCLFVSYVILVLWPPALLAARFVFCLCFIRVAFVVCSCFVW